MYEKLAMMTTIKKQFLTLKNFVCLMLLFAFIQYLDELLESLGVTIENTFLDFLFDGIQMLFIGFSIYIFLRFVERHVKASLLKDSFLHAVFENMDEVVMVCDNDGNLVFVNDNFYQLFNLDSITLPLSYEEWISNWNIFDEKGESKLTPADVPLVRALKGEVVKHQETVYKPIGKPMQYCSVNGKQIVSKTGEIIGALVVIRDISERKEAMEKIKYLAYHDNLTGLPNLRLFKDKVDQFLLDGKRNHHENIFAAIMFLDLDGFKAVNDNFGHDIGDLLLIEVSKRITSCLRKSDIAARIGGDEFTIFLREIASETEAEEIAHSIIQKVGTPFDINKNMIHVTTSIGLSFSPQHGIDRRSLMKNADTAMYTAKNTSKNRYCVFNGVETK